MKFEDLRGKTLLRVTVDTDSSEVYFLTADAAYTLRYVPD